MGGAVRAYYSMPMRELLPASPDGKKICSVCCVEKPISEFYTRAKGTKLRPSCKECCKIAKVAIARPESKECIDCKLEKPASEFYADDRNKTGLNPRCKSCHLKVNSTRVQFEVSVTSKKCTRCHVEKPAEEFARDRTQRSGLRSACNVCRARLDVMEYHQDPDKYREKNRELRNKRPIEKKRNNVLKKYGLTHQDFQDLVAKQGNVCAICAQPEMVSPNLHVDHSHRTGTVRGLLCGHCNRAIGLLQDDPNIALAAAAYLSRNV